MRAFHTRLPGRGPAATWRRDRRFVLLSLLTVVVAAFFWFGSRYPALNDKALMGEQANLSGLSFAVLVEVYATEPLGRRILYTALNWMYTNWQGMTFGLVMGALLMTLLPLLPRTGVHHRFANTLVGVLLGAPMGVCVNCAAPIAQGIYAGGGRAETMLAFLLSSPTLNVIVLSMVFALLPLALGVLKIAATLLVILVGVPLLSHLVPVSQPPAPAGGRRQGHSPLQSHRPLLSELEDAGSAMTWTLAARWVAARVSRHLWVIVRVTVPLMVFTGVLGAAVVVVWPWESLTDVLLPTGRLGRVLLMAGLALLGVFLPVPMTFDVIIVALLLAVGLPVPYAMVLLFTLGIYSVYAFCIVGRSLSWRSATVLFVGLAGLGVVVGGAAVAAGRLGFVEPVDQTINPQGLLLYARASQGREPARRSPPVTFADATAAAGLHHRHASPVIDAARNPGLAITAFMAGAAVGDFNNDGWQDLFVLGGGLQPDALYINHGDGTFTDQAEAWGVRAWHIGSGVAVGDFNNDGWLDLFVTSLGDPEHPGAGQHRLYRNNGDGTLTDVAVAAGVNRTSPEIPDGLGAAFGDYDLDGYLDLYVAGWIADSRGAKGLRLPPSRGNRLFHNNGDGTFTDVTERAGVGALKSHGFTPCFADMNGDRFPELLLVADFGTSRYFVNNRDGTFTDATAASGTGQDHYGMGGVVADLNNDGRLDWFVTSIFFYRKGAGNKLYINQGQHRFTERAVAAGVRDAAWGWGTVAVDLNNDGWLDLVATSGYTRGVWQGRPSRLWINNGDGTFTEMAAAAGFDHRLGGRGLLHVDYDNDGHQDLVVTAHNQELRLYRNEVSGPRANWLRIFLDTRGARTLAPNGYGSRVRVTVGEWRQYRSISGCSGYLSQSELSAHFGLGSAQRVDELRIEWANGSITTMTNVPVNHTMTVQAPP